MLSPSSALPGPARTLYCRWLRFVQVFTSLDLGADGQPHYSGGGGVWQVGATATQPDTLKRG